MTLKEKNEQKRLELGEKIFRDYINLMSMTSQHMFEENKISKEEWIGEQKFYEDLKDRIIHEEGLYRLELRFWTMHGFKGGYNIRHKE